MGSTEQVRIEQPSDGPGGPSRDTGPLRAAFRNRGFLACVLLLALFGGALQGLIAAMGGRVVKDPVPLLNPLSRLNRDKLFGYVVKDVGDIKPEILDNLGTREYIQWTLEDQSTTLPPNAPERIAHLFVTYYTDNPNQVPHVPEECYLGGGYSQTRSEIADVWIPGLDQNVPLKVLTFQKPSMADADDRGAQVVMYTFNTNGQFAADRQAVKLIVGDWRSKYAYFSKLEISFGDPRFGYPTQEQAVEAGKRLLQTVVPVLVNDHWGPAWAKATSRPGAGGAVARAGPVGTGVNVSCTPRATRRRP